MESHSVSSPAPGSRTGPGPSPPGASRSHSIRRALPFVHLLRGEVPTFAGRFLTRNSPGASALLAAISAAVEGLPADPEVSTIDEVGKTRRHLGEVLQELQGFLEERGLRRWAKDEPNAQAVRKVVQRSTEADRIVFPDREAYAGWLDAADPGAVANALICVVHQAAYHLDRVLPSATPASPSCPVCGGPMILRTARRGPRVGSRFWGCRVYPECHGTRRVAAQDGHPPGKKAAEEVPRP